MSVRNGMPYVKKTVPSILGQTFLDFEFVIVDNCSTDGTREYLQSVAAVAPRIRLLLNEHDLGHSGGLNRGLAACQGPWIARIDADDVALPNRLERQLAFVNENPDVVVTSCFAYYINQFGHRKSRTFLEITTRDVFRDYMARNEAIGLLHPGVLMRRDVVQSLGGYREQFGGANDIDLWNRISEKGHLILAQPEYLMEYRVHPGAISSSKFLDSRLKYEWVRECMLARRAGKPEPTREEFLKKWNSADFATRVNRHRKIIAKMYYRKAGEYLITGKLIRGAAYFATSSLLQPGYVWSRISGQILSRYDEATVHGTSSLILRNIQVERGPTASVTAIIACHNTGKFIREAVESCHNQTRPPEKIIVVDDASTDESVEVLNELAQAGYIQLLRNEKNLGRAESFNRALELVNTEFVANLDADDIALPNRFERQLEFMRTHPRLGCCSSFVQYINGPGEKIARGVLDLVTEADFKRYLRSGEPFGLYCPSVLLRSEVVKNPALRFRGQFWPADDIDLWNRIAEAGWLVLAQPEFLTAYRVHASSTVTLSTRTTRMQFEWVRACLRARRSGQPEPSREEFFDGLRRAPLLVRFNRWRKTESKVAYRAAGFAFGERQHWRTAGCFVKAFCLQPWRVSFRVIQQIFES